MADQVARAPRPNVGIRDGYQAEIENLIDQMYRSVLWWIRATYRAREDEIVGDASPARELEKQLRQVFRRQEKRWALFAESAPKKFANSINTNTTNQLKSALRSAGLTVRFKASRKVNNVLQASIFENVNLIKSIPQEFFKSIRSAVMTSIQNGRDLAFLTGELEKQKGISKRRAIMIARDQTNKATEAVAVARAEEIGVTHGFWMARGGGKVPRETHHGIMNGKRFKLSEGLYDPQAERVKGGGYIGRKVKPGELINCHCTFKLDISSITGNNSVSDASLGVVRLHKGIYTRYYQAAIVQWAA